MSKKEYKILEDESLPILNDDAGAYEAIDILRRGISFTEFLSMMRDSIFNMHDWAKILHIDARTLQRYKVSNLTFAPLQSEKILEIKLLSKLGEVVFDDSNHFNSWLDAECLALGGSKPKDLLDNSFGIALVRDELRKIQYGVLA
jgi:putative toxin-antitoxin system antitoxin component (TIGR02293 family)